MPDRCAECQYPLGKFYDGLCVDCKIRTLREELDNLHGLYEVFMQSRADYIKELRGSQVQVEKYREIARDEDAKRLNAEHEVVLLREENDKLRENIQYAADYLGKLAHALTAAGLRGRSGVE